jgi:hypothetical protein
MPVKINNLLDTLLKKTQLKPQSVADMQQLPARPPANVKTLEEIENELLNGPNTSNKEPATNTNGQEQHQQQQFTNTSQMNMQAVMAHLQQQQIQQNTNANTCNLTLSQIQAIQHIQQMEINKLAPYLNAMSLTNNLQQPDRNNPSPNNQAKNDRLQFMPNMSPQDQAMLQIKQQQLIDQHNINQILCNSYCCLVFCPSCSSHLLASC